jgi:hypothetical protein
VVRIDLAGFSSIESVLWNMVLAVEDPSYAVCIAPQRSRFVGSSKGMQKFPTKLHSQSLSMKWLFHIHSEDL